MTMNFTIEKLRQGKRRVFVLRSEDQASLKVTLIFNPETDNVHKFWIFVLYWDHKELYRLTTTKGSPESRPEVTSAFTGRQIPTIYVCDVVEELKALAAKRRERWSGRRDDDISWDRILNTQLEVRDGN